MEFRDFGPQLGELGFLPLILLFFCTCSPNFSSIGDGQFFRVYAKVPCSQERICLWENGNGMLAYYRGRSAR